MAKNRTFNRRNILIIIVVILLAATGLTGKWYILLYLSRRIMLPVPKHFMKERTDQGRTGQYL